MEEKKYRFLRPRTSDTKYPLDKCDRFEKKIKITDLEEKKGIYVMLLKHQYL